MLDAGQFMLVVYCVAAIAAGGVFFAAWQKRGSYDFVDKKHVGLLDVSMLGKWDVISVLVLLAFYGLIVAFEALSPPRDIDAVKITPETVGAIFISQLIPMAVIAFFLFLSGRRMSQYFELSKLKLWHLLCTPLVIIFIYVFFALIMLGGYQDLLKWLFGDEVGEQQMVKIYREIENWETRAMLGVCICIVAPLVEELLFRGVIYRTLKKYSNVTMAAILSSVIFSVVHMNAAALWPLFILAVILVITYELTDSIWIPIAIHALFNFSNLLMMELQRMFTA